jgi:hypothetical protein
VLNPTLEEKYKTLKIRGSVVAKRDGRVKGRAAADRMTQIQYTEEETYSPTIRL